MTNEFDSVPECVAALKKGEIVILVDSSERENEGDFVILASKATKEKINFMVKQARGLLCISISAKKANNLGLHKMVGNTDKFQTPFTVSVDAKTASTGVSVEDRLKTIKLFCSKKAKPSDFVKPGHLFPLVSKIHGVLERQGHTEGSLDLVKLAANTDSDAAVIIEIMNEDGSMARLPDLVRVKKKLGLKMLSIQALVDYRFLHDDLLEEVASPFLPTQFGDFRLFGFSDKVFGKEYVALVKGIVKGKENVLTRIHSACFTGDVLFSKKCDCHDQLVESIKLIQKNGGVLVYGLDQEGRGIGLLNKLRAYELQEKGFDTVRANTALGFKADQRNYAMSAQVIRSLGIKSVRLISNNPQKISEITSFGVKVTQRVPLKTPVNKFNKEYLKVKKTMFSHL